MKKQEKRSCPKKSIVKVMLLALTLAAPACGGGASDKAPSPSASKNFGGMNSAINNSMGALSTIMGGQSSAPKVAIEGDSTGGEIVPINGEVSCAPSGTLSYAGTVQEDDEGWGSFDLDMEFKACEGINGNLSFAGSIFENDDLESKEVTLDGELNGDGCLLKFSALHLTEDETPGGVTQSGDGSLSITCGEDMFACSFDKTNLLDQSAASAACTCAGAGCDAAFEITLTNDQDDSGDDEGDADDEEDDDSDDDNDDEEDESDGFDE